MAKPIRIAIQKDGRLKESSIDYLYQIGMQIEPGTDSRRMLVNCQNTGSEILFVRHSDIPFYVQNRLVDLGIVGENVLFEREYQVKVTEKLGFGKCRLVLAVPDGSGVGQIKELNNLRIVTSYPNSLKMFLQRFRVEAEIIKVNGAAEIAPKLGLADAICDLMQTGRTLRENGLRPIATIYESEAVLIRPVPKQAEIPDLSSVTNYQ